MVSAPAPAGLDSNALHIGSSPSEGRSGFELSVRNGDLTCVLTWHFFDVDSKMAWKGCRYDVIAWRCEIGDGEHLEYKNCYV